MVKIKSQKVWSRSVDFCGYGEGKTWRGVDSTPPPAEIGLINFLKSWGGGGVAKWPPPDMAISSQMAMKLGMGTLWVRIFTN